MAGTLLWARRAGVTMWRVTVSEHGAEEVLPSCIGFVWRGFSTGEGLQGWFL